MDKIKLLVYGEGPTDYGWRDASGEWRAGPIIYLLQKCAAELQTELEIDYVDKSVIDGKKRMKFGMRRTRNVNGKGIPALRFTVYALDRGYTRGIFYCDTDKVEYGKNTRESDCKKHFEKIYEDVLQGLQDDISKKWIGIPMIALKMIECWLLADQDAYQNYFGSRPEKALLPKRPELIWGEKKEPKSDYPKNVMTRVLKQYHKEPGREVFIEIAKATQIRVLLEKCPISFSKFYEDFERLLLAET